MSERSTDVMTRRYLTASASNSAAPRRWSYDVFISFRGEDTRNTFTGYIYHNLRQKGINTFIDDEELRRGEQIGPALLKAIEESHIALIIFSPDYASSSWCLDELTKIVECSESNGQILIPVFYNVERSDVQNHRGTFGEALGEHEKKFREIRETYLENMEKLGKWKAALYRASIAEEHQLKHGDEAEFVERISKDISGRVCRLFLHIARYPVGIDTRLNDLNALLGIGSTDVRMIGIWGIGGIGKTTLAKATFNLQVENFEGGCFLGNVRETSERHKGLIQLQELLLSKILGFGELKINDLNSGKNLIMTTLRNKKVLIVLDDVDQLYQLDALACSDYWFGSGSRIIVTTRNEHLLVVRGVEKRYKVKELQNDEAIELLSWNSFGVPCPPEDYSRHFNPVIFYAMGLPLALTTLGSYLRGQTAKQWERTINKLKLSPSPDIYNVLKVSYDGLSDHEKAIFLDTACFFKGSHKDYVKEVLSSCDLYPVIGIGVLVERSLITIESNKLQMHNLVQSMGWEIVRRESPSPGKRSRLWLREDVLHVLENNTATSSIEGMVVDLPDITEICLSVHAFKAMKRLRLLIVRNGNFSCGPSYLPNQLRWLEWSGYPSSVLPFDFHPKKLAGLKLTFGCLTRMWDGFKACSSLGNLELSECNSLREVPDVSTLPCLQKLTIYNCSSLVKIDESVGSLGKLITLDIQDCASLQILPSKLRMTSLRELFLNGCKSVKRFPDILGSMENLWSLMFDSSGIEELPPSMGKLTGLKHLSFWQCHNLRAIPSSIYNLHSLGNLNLSGCEKLGSFPENAEKGIQLLHSVSQVGKCKLATPSNSKSHSYFPEAIRKMDSLDLSSTHIVTLPHDICKFTNLRHLFLFRCKQLREILALPPHLTVLQGSYCTSLEIVETKNLQMVKGIRITFFCCPKLFKDEMLAKLLDSAGAIESPEGESRSERFENVVLCKFTLSVVCPGSDIPSWFPYRMRGSNPMHFKVHSSVNEKLDGLAICIVFGLYGTGSVSNLYHAICVNGKEVKTEGIIIGCVDEDPTSADHMLTSYLRLSQHVIDNHVQDGWNVVEASFPFAKPGLAKIKKCGFQCVYKPCPEEKNSCTEIKFCTSHNMGKKLDQKTKKEALLIQCPKLRLSQIKMVEKRKRKRD